MDSIGNNLKLTVSPGFIYLFLQQFELSLSPALCSCLDMSRTAKLTVEDLIDFFRGSIVPPSENHVGAEYEIFCLNKESFTRLGYDGSPGIKKILEFLLGQSGGRPIKEADKIVGLEHEDFTISIEPGGQLEASFSPCRAIRELAEKLSNYRKLLKEAESLGVIFIAFGVDPINPFEAVPWMPKKRYQIMRRYWAKKPGLSLYMMKQTAAIQVSIDYNSEEDAIRKLRNAIILSNALTPFCGNSSIYDATYRYTNNFRKQFWCGTDKERSGIPAGCAKPIGSFVDYVDYALNIPIIFLYRDGRYHELAERVTFRQFLTEGYHGFFPVLKDWLLHLNTIFSLVRFNNTTLEIRPFDSNRPEMLLAIAALVKGLFYNNRLYNPLISPGELAEKAREGLPEEDRIYLDPLKLLLREGETCGDRAYRIFRQRGGITSLIDWLKIG